ncbi:ABC transporter substrate-binding protein [Bradyrhizobium sp.]|uniref:ABC transporter substrate-binding protein n=1 Tax=Bradyrhizobium sp. TaxID=376 RepID=UPI003BAE3A4D
MKEGGPVRAKPCKASAERQQGLRQQQEGIRDTLDVLRLGAFALAGTADAQSPNPVKIGVLNDQSGIYADLAGPGSVIAARLAVEDAGGSVLGRPIEVVVANHQGKPDIGAAIARRWYDADAVSAIFDVPVSSIALAVQEVARQKNRIAIFSSASASDILGKSCNPTTFQWTFNTLSAARSTASAVFDQGANSWYFVAADYAFGRAMVRDATNVINEKGGKVLGTVWHPLGTSDFASYLLQAQSSGAKVVAFVSGGSDFINALKQSNEFGLAASGQKIVSMQTFISDIHAIGLPIAQNLTLTAAFYWDLDDQTRAWSKRFGALSGGKMPTMAQAGVYSGVRHYLKGVAKDLKGVAKDLKGVAKAQTTDGSAVAAAMREIPVEDMMTHGARIRDDGWVMRDLYLFQVKTPTESKAPWDYYKLLSEIGAEQAAPPRLPECK